MITDPNCIVDKINYYFVSVHSEIYKSTYCAPDDLPISQPNYADSFFIMPTNNIEVINGINNLNNKKSTGADIVSKILLNHIAEYISPVPVDLINISFISGVFHDKLRQSRVY